MSSPPSSPRSAFVDSLGWSFLVLGAFGGLLNLAQWVFLQFTVQPADLAFAVRELRTAGTFPGWLLLILEHLHLWLASLVALSALTVFASWALLKRHEWARRFFVVSLWIGAALNFAGVALPFMPSRGPSLADAIKPLLPADLAPNVGGSLGYAAWSLAGCALAFGALFAWAALRLSASKVRAEFANCAGTA
jgi:hypothetical protein